MFNHSAHRLTKATGAGDQLLVKYTNAADDSKGEVVAKWVFLCTYSKINRLLKASQLPLISFKHELAEIALIEVPEELKNVGVTIMCGPFFSTMPFPARKVHSLYHVRYAPHFSWHESEKLGMPNESVLKLMDEQAENKSRANRFAHMLKDAQRYLPVLSKAKYVDSLWEFRTVLPQSEGDDSRPIVFKRDYDLKNFVVVAGGKIDNVFDVMPELDTIGLT